MVYIDQIWNKFFVRKNDRFIFIFFLFAQTISSIWIAFRPHYWYINITIFQLMLFIVLFTRYRKLSHETESVKPPDTNKLCELYLLYSAVQNIGIKFLIFSFPFIMLMCACHILRHFIDNRSLEFFLIGAYSASALLLTYLSSVGFIIRAMSSVQRLADRAIKGDISYFEGIYR